MEMEEDCFRKLVSSEVFAPSKSARRSTSDEQKITANGTSTFDLPTEEANVQAESELPAETAVVPPQQNLQLSDDSAEASSRSEDSDDNGSARHKRKVSHGSSSTSFPSDKNDLPPPTKKICTAPLVKSEEPIKEDAIDEERMDESTSVRDEQPQPSAEESSPALPVYEEEGAKIEADVKVVTETAEERETEIVIEPKVEEVETKVDMATEMTPELKSVHSDEVNETEDIGDGDEQPPLAEGVASSTPTPPDEEDSEINAAINEAMEEEQSPAADIPQPETVHCDEAKENDDAGSSNLRQRTSSGEFSSYSSNKMADEAMQSTSAEPKSPSPPPPPKAPTPPPMLLAHDLLAKAKLAKKLSQKPISLEKLKQQARAKAIEKAMQQGKGGKKQKRKGERKSRRYQKAPPPKPQTSEASTNSSEEAEENVEKIVMNTGTLYLYRGDNPRAEFIRKK